MRSTSPLTLLAFAAGLAAPALALAQAQVNRQSADPVVRAALSRVYPRGGGGATDATGPDVIVGEIQDFGFCCPDGEGLVTNPAATVGSVVAYGIGTSSCNIGTQHVLWVSSTPYHPIIPQNMYRLKAVNGSTRFEQIGQSWSKYAFVALNYTVCGGPCTASGSVLGVGCSDPYSSSLNASQLGLGPRYQCNPFTGDYPDQGQAWRNATWPPFPGSTPPSGDATWRRLRVNADDLAAGSNPGALYFAESMYIARDDHCFGNLKNNASYRRFTVGAGNVITFQGVVGGNGTQRGKVAINAWRDHGGGVGVSDPGVMISEVTCGNTFFAQPAFPYDGGGGPGTLLVSPAGDGWVYIGSRATDLGGGLYHYEFAVENMNSDRGVGSFSVPIPAGAVITNAGWKQIDCHSGIAAEDANRNAAWVQTIGPTSVSWASPHTYNGATPALGSYIRWGTLYNFRFDANVPPATGNVSLGYFKPLAGYVDTIAGSANIPGALPPPACYADCDLVGGLTGNDFQCFLNAFVAGSSYADCDTVGGLTANDFQCFLNAFVAGCS